MTDPSILAVADQEMAGVRVWLAELARLHPHAVQELGPLEAVVGLAAHIRDSVTANTPNPENVSGWGVAAVAVAMLSEQLYPPVELPPLVVRQDDPQFVGKVVRGLLDANRPTPVPRRTDANGECSCHINPPCHWCSSMCCAEHIDVCLAGFPAPCCDKCPDTEPCCGDHVDSCVAPAYPCCNDCPHQGD